MQSESHIGGETQLMTYTRMRTKTHASRIDYAGPHKEITGPGNNSNTGPIIRMKQ